MKAALAVIPLIALATTSCDKAKDLADKVTTAVKHEIATQMGDGDKPEADPELQKLVDQTDYGVLFRKDLPFPQHLEVRTTERREVSGRIAQTSAIGQQAGAMNGTQITITKLERAGDQVRYTLEQSSFAEPVPTSPDGVKKTPANALQQTLPAAKPITFRQSNGKWQADDRGGFRAAALSKQLSPVFDQLLIEYALAPRPLWLSKRRIKPGETIAVSGDSLPMLLGGQAKGAITLRFDSLEPVNGHPCGVFTVTGGYKRKSLPDFEGNVTDESVSIQSGKMWLSLLHPVILKTELDTIQSAKSGSQGNSTMRGQGAVKISMTREWKPQSTDDR